MIRILSHVAAGHEEHAPRLMHDKLGGPHSRIGTNQRIGIVLTDGDTTAFTENGGQRSGGEARLPQRPPEAQQQSDLRREELTQQLAGGESVGATRTDSTKSPSASDKQVPNKSWGQPTAADSGQFALGVVQGFFVDGLAGDAQAIIELAKDPLSIPRDIYEASVAAGNSIYRAVESWFGMSEMEQALAIAKVGTQINGELATWKSLGEKLTYGRSDFSDAELDKLNRLKAIADAIAQELSKFAEELSPEMMGRIAGMIAYELVLEAGIASAAVATAGAASTLTAARLALIVNKLKKLGPIGDKGGDLLKP
ncbi:MAG: hypothetical protein ACK517_03705, partial [bacterium]